MSDRLYMFDGLYQSLICFFLPYLLFAPASFNSESGRSLNDNRQLGVYIANASVVVVNVYIMMNTYRWDWVMILVTSISTLFVFAWTGIYTSFTASFQFYKAGAQVYGSAGFWAVTFLTIVLALLPRFAAKSFQKVFMPRDVDIIREQVRMGKFKYLDDVNADELLQPLEKVSLASLDNARPRSEDERPIYPPSVRDSTVRDSQIDPSSAAGSDDTRMSNGYSISRPSYDRPRTSYERQGLPGPAASHPNGPLRASFENSRDFTSAAGLMRVESNGLQSQQQMRKVYEDFR